MLLAANDELCEMKINLQTGNDARVEQAKTRLAQAETQTQQAKTHSEQVETQTEQSKTRMEQAETRTGKALHASVLSKRRLFEAAQAGAMPVDRSLNLFRTLIDESSDGFEVIDLETGRFLGVNETTCRRLGYQREELLSLSVPDIEAVAVDFSSWHKLVEDIRQSGFKILEGRHKRKDGSTFPVEVSVRHVKLDRDYLVAAVRDITKRKQAEESQRTSEARFRRLVDSNVQGVMFSNMKGEIIKANDAFLDIVGYTRKDMEAGRLNWGALSPPKYAEADRHAVAETVATGVFTPYEKEYLRKDGARVPILIGGAAFEDDSGEGVCFVIDITERKQAEEALKNSQAQLRALSARLQSVREDESERIAREIHDELGQALTTLNMDLIWIQQKLKAEKSPLLRPQFQRRMKAATALLETTVRSVQRISTELRPAMLDDLGLTATLEWQAEEFEARTGIHCQWKLKPATVRPNRDQATALFRIFQEILTNVARHSRARSVNLRLVQNDGKLILEVADDGKGFDEKKLLLHKSLGLLGIRERAAFIGGGVEICSAPGKGAKITVTSPVTEPGRPRKLKTGGSHGQKSKNSHRR